MDNRKHILIVDDNAENLKVTAGLLIECAYKVSLAMNGMIALDLLSKTKPDLILLDVMMPDMDGIELCNSIKANEEMIDIPIIFLTARNQTGDLIKGFKAGGVDYISKPFIREELLARIDTHLQLFDSKQKITELLKSRDKLYAIIAHDIRSPLGSIQMALDAVKSASIEPNSNLFREIIEKLSSSVDHTLQLLNNLLEWNRKTNQRVEFFPEKFNLLKVVTDCIQLLEGVASNKMIALNVQIEKRLEVFADENSMQTVFRNLISNALKFTGRGGEIWVSAKEHNAMIDISVRDTGVGMSKEVLEKLFVNREYYSSKGTENEKGNGIGLLMVSDFIEKNNGILKVNSIENQGTEIIVSVPANSGK